MTAPQNFRSAFNGFNKDDVVHYLEYANARHTAQVNQLTTENESLRQQLEKCPSPDQLEALQQQYQALEEQLKLAQERCAELEAQLSRKEEAEAPEAAAPVPGITEELEVYRRAERIEREARERAELVYFQANGVLTEASAKVDGIAADITDMADQVMSQLTQLQVAVSSSKRALQDAASIMGTIRPNK